MCITSDRWFLGIWKKKRVNSIAVTFELIFYKLNNRAVDKKGYRPNTPYLKQQQEHARRSFRQSMRPTQTILLGIQPPSFKPEASIPRGMLWWIEPVETCTLQRAMVRYYIRLVNCTLWNMGLDTLLNVLFSSVLFWTIWVDAILFNLTELNWKKLPVILCSHFYEKKLNFTWRLSCDENMTWWKFNQEKKLNRQDFNAFGRLSDTRSLSDMSWTWFYYLRNYRW